MNKEFLWRKSASLFPALTKKRMSGFSLMKFQASEEEIARKVSPLEEKINANKKLATILEEQKEAREYVEKLAKEAKKLDEEISRLKASIYETNEEGEAQLTDEEIARAEKVINVCTRKLEKIRKRMECPLGESKTQRINDKLNALAYKNVIMEEKITAIKETKSIPVRLAKFKEELERLEREKTEDKPVYCKLSAKEIYERVTNAARILGITEYLNRKPRALSGGQRQRVAIGRAIVRNPKILLMDEPLSNLDAKLRVQTRTEIANLHKKIGATTIYVTHDQTEAMTMADRIVVMKLGVIQQIGTPIEIYKNPVNLFVASFIGSPAMNLIKGKYSKGVVTFLSGEKFKLSPEQVKRHDAFYRNKLAEEINLLPEYEEKLNAEKEEFFKKHHKAKEVNEFNTKFDEFMPKKHKEVERLEKIVKGEEHEIIFGVRPEDILIGGNYEFNVKVNENTGHFTLTHGKLFGKNVCAKLKGWQKFKENDVIKVSFNRDKIYLFDKETTNAIE